MKFEIKSRFSGTVLFEGDYESMAKCVEAAVKALAYLAGAVEVAAVIARLRDGAFV